MTTVLDSLPFIALGVGGWMVVNGILHDIFVLRSEHGKKFDRELLRLLMDGHILITCGLMQMISYMGLRSGEYWAFFVAATSSVSLLIYCALIFRFLKSLGTIFLNSIFLVLLVIKYV